MQLVININENDYKTLMINSGNCSVSMAERIIDSVYQGKKLPNSMWIPVNERLPKAGEYVGDVAKYYLVQNEYGDMLVARYTHSEHWEQIYQMKPIADEVVAWMPLPQPYKEEKEDNT